MRVALAAAVACLVIVSITQADPANAAVRRPIAIAAQDLRPALQQLSRDHGLQFVFRTDIVANRRTSGATGDLTIDEALAQLLAGTGLVYQYLDDKTVTIMPAPVPAPVAPRATRANDTLWRSAGPNGESVPSGEATADTDASSRGFWSRFRLAQAETASRASSAPGTENSERASERRVLEEVIVTAQKREERTIDVPMSITAMSGQELAAAGISNALDLSFRVPSMSVAETGPGRQLITIRGIGSDRGSSSLTGVYLDEMPVTGVQSGFGYIGAPDVRAVDLERVEVLKGPQGTLFGEGAAGGVVRFITRDPDLSRPGGEVSAQLYNITDGEWSGEVIGIGNIPLAEDVFGARIVAMYRNESGWIDQPSIGREDINDGEMKFVRAKALYTPTPRLQLRGLAEIHRSEGGASNIVNQEPREDSNFLQAFDRSARTDYWNDNDLFNLSIIYDLGFAELLSSTSYAKIEGQHSLTQVLDAEPRPWLEILSRELAQDASIASQELRLTSATQGSVNWTLGAAYKDAELVWGLGDSGSDLVLFGGGFVLATASPNLTPTNQSESWAAFADLSYEFIERLEIGGGLRYFYDERKAFDPSAPDLGSVSGDFDKVTFRAYFKVEASENANLYLSVANGFRSGGFNAISEVPRGAPASYGSEETIFYEAGTKMSLLGGRMRFDGAVFYGEFDGLQGDILIPSPVDGLLLGFTKNDQDGELKGVELSIEWAATDRLTLGLAGDVIDSEITRIFDQANIAPNYFVGDPINYAPEYSLSARADYAFNWSDSVPGSVLLSFSRQGESHLTERSNALVSEDQRQVVKPELTFLNASIGAEGGGWKWTVFGWNLLDERRALNPTVTGFAAQARPRTVGLGVNKTF